ncbi:MAG: VPLPA-CTERM sorting domain-containing protein [Pseudomonadota bacterium]
MRESLFLKITEYYWVLLNQLEVHIGAVDGTEVAGIDNPWSFFDSTGLHLSTAPLTVLSTSGNTATIDMSGWSVTWDAISVINMGGGIQDCGTGSDGICSVSGFTDISGLFDNGTGVASITCAVDCSEGDRYTLDYAAIVPRADPSNFGGVSYELHLEGTVSSVPVPAAIWLFGSGLFALAGVSFRRKRLK